MRSILAARTGTPQPTTAGDALVLELPRVPTRPLSDYALGGPALVAVLVVGVAVGVLQAATQINEPTIPFVVKVVGLVVVMAATGHFLLGRMVAFTIDLFHRIPHLIG